MLQQFGSPRLRGDGSRTGRNHGQTQQRFHDNLPQVSDSYAHLMCRAAGSATLADRSAGQGGTPAQSTSICCVSFSDDAPPIGPAHLLHLSTRAGALALGMDEVGDLSLGSAADFVLMRPPPGSTLEAVLRHSDSPERTLGALFALAREESVAEVWVAGEAV